MQRVPPTTTFVVIDGIIGAGKTTLIDILSTRAGRMLLSEPVDPAHNPYLDDFYRVLRNEKANQGEPVLMQLHLLLRRYQAQVIIEKLQNTTILQDRCFWADKIFAELNFEYGTISEREYVTYCGYFDELSERAFLPSLVLFLDVSPRIAFERIKKRGRAAEISMPLEYLERLSDKYHALLEWFDGHTTVLRIPYNTPAFAPHMVEQIETIISEHVHTRQQRLFSK